MSVRGAREVGREHRSVIRDIEALKVVGHRVCVPRACRGRQGMGGEGGRCRRVSENEREPERARE
eukprot:6207741-Pleurochrysis_carterae.AAC.5